ncbi:GTP-binding protein RAD [Trachymyrmex zeteki]|uniref:GTP-binding protein RAD n=1 Tax=Mycetomoellerius zeteki TaxID=64791 RepID=A0A151X322_9HYME|nr:GTP-binding protein RAD [Trachymyrmex zeteki]
MVNVVVDKLRETQSAARGSGFVNLSTPPQTIIPVASEGWILDILLRDFKKNVTSTGRRHHAKGWTKKAARGTEGCSRNRESAIRCGSLGNSACDTGDTSQSQPSRGQHGADGGGGGGGGGEGFSRPSDTLGNAHSLARFLSVLQVTTTDGEQPDDSFDLIDVPAEMSPPATAPSQSSIPPVGLRGHPDDTLGGNHNSSPTSPTSPISVAAPIAANQTTPPLPLPSSPMTPLCAFDETEIAGPSNRSMRMKLDSGQQDGNNKTTTGTSINQGHNASNNEGTATILPSLTSIVSTHHETRFTFGGSGRTPPLPDLRAADFFSTPVRGSVDAGQPDSVDTRSSIRNLVAAQEKHNARVGYQIDYAAGGKVNSIQVTASEKGTIDHKRSQKRPNINVTTNPLDISLISATQPCNTQGCNVQSNASTKSRGRSAGGSGGSKRSTQATIVVQQPSLSLDAPAATILLHPDADARRREENMRQLLDVANTLTLQEIHDFEMSDDRITRRYGSPHHSRSQSVKAPGSRSSGRPNYLCLPQQRSRVASMPNTGVEEEYYRLRHFSITGKGVVNRGDSLKSRRSRSNNSMASSNSSTEHLTASYPGSARNSAAGSLASSRESSASQGPAPYRVLMLGAPAVGKSSLVSQFMTSEYLHAYDTSIDDESGEKTVSVLLAGEESELTFIDHSCAEMTPENCISTYEPHAYCVVYSTTDRASVRVAEEVLQSLWRSDHVSARAVILVGNKVDLVRSRLVSTEEGKSMATSYDCKFIETSVGINHNVDELLVGLLTQIRLKLENPERTREMFRKRSRKNRSKSPLGSCSENNSPKKYRGSRTSTSLKVRNLLDKVWARDSKSKSCENLHVL